MGIAQCYAKRMKCVATANQGKGIKMAISFNNALGVHEQALLLRDQRSQVIATNIANSDTPGYKSRDLDFSNVLKQRMGLSNGDITLRTSHARHISDSSVSLGTGPVSEDALMYRTPVQPSLDGNTVDEQLENANFAKNAMQHQASFQFLNGKFAGLKKALRGE